jgi:hypothetical protein
MPTERSGGALVFRVHCHRKVAGNGWDEPCKSRGLRTVLWAAGGEIPPADPASLARPCDDGRQGLRTLRTHLTRRPREDIFLPEQNSLNLLSALPTVHAA